MKYYKKATNYFTKCTIDVILLTLSFYAVMIYLLNYEMGGIVLADNIGLCLGCMNKLDDNGNCNFCNYDSDVLQSNCYLTPGTVLDERYIVGRVLSYNGEGVSYIGYDNVTSEKVVVREYFPDTLCKRSGDSDKIIVNQDCLAKYKTFMSEFAEVYKVLSRLRNLPHIVPAVDMFAQNNTTYAILEYVEGVSLRRFLQENSGTLTWEQVKKIFPPIFTTLSLIHNSGVVHRGICPENIIVTVKGELKLIGFCISSIRTINTELNPELYSGYAAPEQYTSLDWQGTWTDVYAICAVLYRILTGTVPPEAHGRTNNDRLIEPIRLNQSIPVQVSQVITEGLVLRGENRIQSITELVTRLFEQPQYVEHTKGATQTIPIAKPVVKQNSKTVKQEEDKLKEMLPTIISVSVVVVIMLLAIFLVYQIFFASGADEEETKKTKTSTTTSYVPQTITTPAITTEAPVIEENPVVDLGTGAIMPDVIAQHYEGVKGLLERDFTVELVYEYSDIFESGIIMDQSIAPDTQYSPENLNKLVITVSYGPEKVPVPEFMDCTQAEYIEILDDLKIKYKLVNYETANVKEGYVAAVSIKVGDDISIKDGEILTVSIAVKPPEEVPPEENENTTGEGEENSDTQTDEGTTEGTEDNTAES